jgi:predicted nucleic acid-binding protein
MAIQNLVIIDTCIWVPFFNRPRSAEKQAVDVLLDDDRAALIGPILTEILIGFRRDEQADWVASVLHGLQFFEPSWDEWQSAAELGRHLMAAGHKLPQSDLIIAAVAKSRNYAVYTNDPHFDLIANLVRYTP